jgi:NAD(P)-dependent dehydrogenase (short-subunit alcohol dehydrogenase family)
MASSFEGKVVLVTGANSGIGETSVALFIEAAVPLGRMASTEEVCRWIVSLADPTVTWITGQVISVDGGR